MDWGLSPTGEPSGEDAGQYGALWGRRILAAAAMVAADVARSLPGGIQVTPDSPAILHRIIAILWRSLAHENIVITFVIKFV